MTKIRKSSGLNDNDYVTKSTRRHEGCAEMHMSAKRLGTEEPGRSPCGPTGTRHPEGQRKALGTAGRCLPGAGDWPLHAEGSPPGDLSAARRDGPS